MQEAAPPPCGIFLRHVGNFRYRILNRNSRSATISLDDASQLRMTDATIASAGPYVVCCCCDLTALPSRICGVKIRVREKKPRMPELGPVPRRFLFPLMGHRYSAWCVCVDALCSSMLALQLKWSASPLSLCKHSASCATRFDLAKLSLRHQDTVRPFCANLATAAAAVIRAAKVDIEVLAASPARSL